jgi:GT2 family glycosyltransferase
MGREPVLVGDLHLDHSWSTYPLGDTSRYGSARLLVRQHGRPIGEVVVPLAAGGPTAELLRRLVKDQLGDDPEVPGLGVPELPTATVVIATRDRPDSLMRCLDSLAGSSHPAYDVVVVDSASSTDRTAQLLDRAADLWPFTVRSVRADRPGLGYAHQLAIGELSGTVAAFTDDDVEIDPHWLASITAPFVCDEVACVTGLILPAELETAAQQWIEDAGGFARGFESRRYSVRHPPGDRLFPFTAGRFGSGANMAFRSEWLRKRGGFDPATGAGTPAHGGDDLNAFLRVLLDGHTLVYEPAAIVRHHHRREYSGLRRQAFGYGVGLGAYLASAVRHEPRAVAAMVRRAVPALRHLLAADSAKNVGRGSDFPRELVWRERAGVCVGPFAYAFSRWRYRDVIRAGVDR